MRDDSSRFVLAFSRSADPIIGVQGKGTGALNMRPARFTLDAAIPWCVATLNPSSAEELHPPGRVGRIFYFETRRLLSPCEGGCPLHRDCRTPGEDSVRGAGGFLVERAAVDRGPALGYEPGHFAGAGPCNELARFKGPVLQVRPAREHSRQNSSKPQSDQGVTEIRNLRVNFIN